eukprot:CAMPEP_0179063940 /NCGR_PEP_ID=MMETSP0796-20121207/27694_1 /TAXON_ID=73915 /ORGANISM="Pyrodinium bahamense, Strain pbaha01" /LENGTH=68 /DNA_ID=CAMNT_0020760877 /DNA_START=72 /DNA_END=278 /DNA_ORIENTATION=-
MGGSSGKEAAPASAPEPAKPKPTKKICCACPETKAARDECIMLRGEERCKDFIEVHNQCLRAEGFDVK